MKKIFVLTLIIIFKLSGASSQVLQVDTLLYNGDISKYINIVILGDGYTAGEQEVFIQDANYLSSYILTQVPWVNYNNYFNVFAIRVISLESGAKHPNTAPDCNSAWPLVPVSNPNTYLSCSFDSYGIHRLVVPQNTTHIINILAANFPAYDQVLVIAHSPYYGGSGGNFATSTTETSSSEIIAHEIGHSFADLADEYYAGDVYAAEKANMTQENTPSTVRWTNWMGYNGVGIFQHCCGGNSALWYKPGDMNCKMEILYAPYCSVCAEAIIESVHSLVNPIASYTPVASTINTTNQFIDFKLTELMKPNPNTLCVVWKLDTVVISNNTDSLQINQNNLSIGLHTLMVNVTDTSSLLRVDNHPAIHFSTVTWTINKTTGIIDLTSLANKITISLYPNPAVNSLTIGVDLQQRCPVKIELFSVDGVLIQPVFDNTMDEGEHIKTINIESLKRATYLLRFTIGDNVYIRKFLKQ